MINKSNTVRVEGTVEEALPGLLFRVKIGNSSEKEVLAHLGGRLKINRIRVIPGDRVLLEMANLNDDRARIIKRF